jgi:hypothetical protein
MRAALKLLLGVFVAVAAGTGLTVTPVSAQGVEVIRPDVADHCPSAAGGGCEIHAVGEFSLVGHVFGIEVTASDCNVELAGYLDEDGEGQITSGSMTSDASHNCTRTLCSTSGTMNPWPIHIDETGTGTEAIQTEICLRPSSGGDNRCLITAPITDIGLHDYRITFNDTAGTNHAGADCELTSGHLDLETDTNIEITHPGN